MAHNSKSKKPNNLPSDFFDFNKKTKKDQDDELENEMEQFEKEMQALEAESNEKLKGEFEKLQQEKTLDELDQQLEQWKRIVELEKRAEQLKNKPLDENPTKKFKNNAATTHQSVDLNDPSLSLDDIEDFEDKLLDWRCKKI